MRSAAENGLLKTGCWKSQPLAQAIRIARMTYAIANTCKNYTPKHY